MPEPENLEHLKKDAADQLNRLINKIRWGRKHPRDYGTGELLYMSEIEAIDAVGRHPGINLTELSEHLGVTKATLSPIVNKLESRGYLSKQATATNSRVKRLLLQEKGVKARQCMGIYANKFNKYMAEVTRDELSNFLRLLQKMEMFIDDLHQELRK